MSQLVTTARIIDKTSTLTGSSQVEILASNTAGMAVSVYTVIKTVTLTAAVQDFHADLRDYSAIKVRVTSSDASPCSALISVLSLGADV
jgi:hypothetical protein